MVETMGQKEPINEHILCWTTAPKYIERSWILNISMSPTVGESLTPLSVIL